MNLEKKRDFNILLDDRAVEFIMEKFNLGIYDILLAIDNNKITIERRELGTLSYYYIIIDDMEFRLSDNIAKMDVQAYEKGNTNYYKELARQCLKYEIAVEVSFNDVLHLLESGTNVYYKTEGSDSSIKINRDSRYTLEEYSKMKFFIKK